MATLKDKIQLALFGKPIIETYKVFASEKVFKETVKSKMTPEDFISPFSSNSPPFKGQFHGFYERELAIKPTTSFWRKDSLSESISIHGEITPIDDKTILLKLTFNRTRRMRLSLLVLIAFVLIAFLIVWSKNPNANGFPNSLIINGFILLFLVAGLVINILDISRQFDYTESYLLNDFKNF